jgi:2-methylcitrate dehydratase PrpD
MRLGAFAASCATAQFDTQILDNAAFCWLDAFGLGLLAKDEPTVAAMADLSAGTGGARKAWLWAGAGHGALAAAVEANATAVHGHFHDDSDYASWSHPGSLIVPPAVSLCDADGLGIDAALRGIIAGYAAVDWLGAGERVARGLISNGIRTSPTLGTIGAAATGAAILKLDAERAANAIGISTSITGGLLEPVRVGSDEWRIQNAHAARGGIMAAELAARGVLGAQSALDGPKGLLPSYARMDRAPDDWQGDPRPDAVVRAVAKPYATLGDNMSAAIAAKLLFDDGVDHTRIRDIEITLWRPYSEYPGTDFRGPFDRIAQAMASTVFAVGTMLSKGRLTYAENDAGRTDRDVLRLAGLARIEPDDVGDAEDSRITLTLDDGTKLSRHSREAPRTLLYHDRDRARQLLGDRAEASGLDRNRAVAICDTVFGYIDGGPDRAIADLLAPLFDGGT